MTIKDISQFAPQLISQLSNGGAFMTVSEKDVKNTMTIGWGTIGVVWGKPILMVAVRYSRHTYDLIEKAQTFTVSVPKAGKLKGALGFCGSKSGRDYDKFAECKLAIQQGKKVDVPIIVDCELHFECKVVYQQTMEPKCVGKEVKDKFYANGNYHVMYYGEIVDCYNTKK